MTGVALAGGGMTGASGLIPKAPNRTATPFDLSTGVAESQIPAGALSAIQGMVSGTGGILTEALMSLVAKRATGAEPYFVVLDDSVKYITDAQSTSDVVNSIRSAFGLSITDLAIVLGVERPTIYSWLKDQSTPHGSRLARIGLVLQLADAWVASRKDESAPLLTSEVSPGVTLIAALHDAHLWQREILHNLTVQASASRRSSRKGRLVALAREQELPERTAADFDLSTNRALGPAL